MPFNQPLKGLIEPSVRSWSSATAAERKALYEQAGKLAVKAKRDELTRAIGRNGRTMKPRKRPRPDGADGPVLTPHDRASRTDRLMDAKATATGCTLFWHSGIRRGQKKPWGTILGYHADGKVRGAPKRDVRLSTRSINKVKADLARWWTAFRSAATRAETRAATATPGPGLIDRVKARARRLFTRPPAPVQIPAPTPAAVPAPRRSGNRPLTAEQRAMVARYPNLKPYLLNPRDGFGPVAKAKAEALAKAKAPAEARALAIARAEEAARKAREKAEAEAREKARLLAEAQAKAKAEEKARKKAEALAKAKAALAKAPRFGLSKAKVEDSGRASIAEAEAAATHIFGKPVKARDLATLAGAPDDAVVTFEAADKDYIIIQVDSPHMNATRTIHAPDKYATGIPGIRIHNDQLVVKSSARGQGLGASILGRQVEHAADMGVGSINTLAARMSGTYTDGYAVWPKLGYDGELPRSGGFNPMPSLPSSLAGAKRVSDLMATEEGTEWWTKNGVTVDLEFDLAKGSLSRARLETYLIRKAAEKAAKAKAKAP